MTVKELIDMLSLRRNDEEVFFVADKKHYRYKPICIWEEKSEFVGGLAIKIDNVERVEITEEHIESAERLHYAYKKEFERQKTLEQRILERLEKLEKKTAPPKKRNRTRSEQIAAGFVPTGKRGRPAKLETIVRREEEARLRREELIKQGINPDEV